MLSNILPRLQCVRDELLTGAILFSAVFLINEPYTCVHHRMGRVLYGVLVGVVSMGFRYYGVYETGVCFALLAVNSVSAWIDRTEAKLYHLIHLQADAGKGARICLHHSFLFMCFEHAFQCLLMLIYDFISSGSCFFHGSFSDM